MPRTCATCSHSKRAAIEAALVTGEPLRNISKRYGTSPAALLRHRNRCVSTAIVKAKDAAETMHGDVLLEKVRQLEADARRIAGRAEKEGDLRAALAGVRQLADLIALLVSLAAKREVKENVLQTAPEWIELCQRLVDELREVPGGIEALRRACGETPPIEVKALGPRFELKKANAGTQESEALNG